MWIIGFFLAILLPFGLLVYFMWRDGWIRIETEEDRELEKIVLTLIEESHYTDDELEYRKARDRLNEFQDVVVLVRGKAANVFYANERTDAEYTHQQMIADHCVEPIPISVKRIVEIEATL